ncbi:hypothetical protein MOB49_10855 [Bacillus haynesii]|uniref:hypothetical protein n=1 Tax=Bacillus haynesii TaxID=1925021 RepID=UPI0012B930DB|nr:hypothetical protein [Bacillus haynesii]TWK15576.1 hypothetical protein CHCC20375_3048 [Bacillus licheniformis]MCY7846479.1 hypothetical protein [Bacillus haynesii]MCY7967592.1 hypothetical protein [Bacillus haynesii]MCY7991870.1 hypothetical protein [Bacillus haynesii]MCY8016918.1 hypothetical protein [Bacillus haynesii]
MFFVQMFIFFMLTICFWLLIASFKKKAFAVLLLLTAAAVLSLFASASDVSDRALCRIVLFAAIPVSAIAAKLSQDRRKTE